MIEYNDDNLTIQLNGGNPLKFKAFLEDSDISYDMKDQQLPFVPTSFNNDSMMLMVKQKLKLSFNVFSDNRNECRENYKNLLALIHNIKPLYFEIYDQYAPSPNNVNGYFRITFKGLPLTGDTQTLHITNFSYVINKDMGYIEMPWEERPNNDKYYSNNSNKLIPIAYKLSIEGRILQQFPETTRINNITPKDYSAASRRGTAATNPVSNVVVTPQSAQKTGTNNKTDKFYYPVTRGLANGVEARLKAYAVQLGMDKETNQAEKKKFEDLFIKAYNTRMWNDSTSEFIFENNASGERFSDFTRAAATLKSINENPSNYNTPQGRKLLSDATRTRESYLNDAKATADMLAYEQQKKSGKP